jgi:serine/threonine-protein kinase RsbW
MSRMKTFPRPTASNDHEQKSGHRGSLLLMLALYSNPKWLSVVRGAVERLTEALGFPAVQSRSIIRAVDEALTNIVRHSYANRPDQPIAMYFRRTQRGHDGAVQQGLEILLCDRGSAVDINRLRGRSLDQVRPGGLGLHWIRQAMDTVEFTRKGPTNQLRLVKYLAQTSNAP